MAIKQIYVSFEKIMTLMVENFLKIFSGRNCGPAQIPTLTLKGKGTHLSLEPGSRVRGMSPKKAGPLLFADPL
ncbi:MAG: hypothetical protein VR69_12170 [Peptococcaceae bacterium BRH_c4b]|nr:MAG: hypothetical protein VR69_12170 [Peptococcaceae bacterium BRH_c4b]